MLSMGDPAPWFVARSTVNPKFVFDTVGGRYIILTFFGSAANPASRRILNDIEQNQHRFDVENALFFGVSTDPDDEAQQRVRQQFQGIIYFWDFDLAVSRLYEVAAKEGQAYQPQSIILSPSLRTLAVLPFDGSPETHVARLFNILSGYPPIKNSTGLPPVICIPHILEPEFCQHLIGLYQRHGGHETGVMRDISGKTYGVADYSVKRRSDYDISDPNVLAALQNRLQRRLLPEIKKCFHFNTTHIEHYIVACYDASVGGYFRAHRDNVSLITAHRKFAVTINLNADYEGGNLRFPEYGPVTMRAPIGGAIVF